MLLYVKMLLSEATMKFTKMQGTGNDFILYINLLHDGKNVKDIFLTGPTKVN